MKPNHWRMRPAPRSLPVNGGRQASNNTRSHFPRPEVMQPTAVINSEERAREKEVEVNIYLSPIPPSGHDSNLFEARLIIAGPHLVPLGLERPEIFDAIRIRNKAWVEWDGDCAMNVKSKHPLGLKQACKDLYSLLRDLRLTSERPTPRFIVQRPSPWLREGEEARISIVAGRRPVVIQQERPTKTCIDPIVDDLSPKTASHFMPIAMSLTGLDKNLQMRISFGRLNLREKKKSIGEATTYARMPGIMKAYAKRGTATLGSRLPIHHFPQIPEFRQAIERLTNPLTGIRGAKALGKQLVIKHQLVITLKGETGTETFSEVRADMSGPTLGPPRMIAIETFPRFDWTILAPDREYDWNMRAHNTEVMNTVPSDFQELLSKTKAGPIPDQKEDILKVRTITLPYLSEERKKYLDEKVENVQIKMTVQLQFEDAPYTVEANVTQIRPGIDMTIPNVSWGVDFYGSQWDESLNHVSPDGLRKDWGRGLVNVWPNKEGGLEPFETRFGHMLSCVLKAQAALEGLKIEEMSNALI